MAGFYWLIARARALCHYSVIAKNDSSREMSMLLVVGAMSCGLLRTGRGRLGSFGVGSNRFDRALIN